MTLSEKCPVCKGRLAEREIEKFLKSNGDTAVLKVMAEVCLQCNMKFFAPRIIAEIAKVKNKLKKGQTKGFIVTGKSYKIA
jgi:YgiT-type zinc finger domain-containing protein